jgi:ribosomal protein S18 acetylase RimI-like enzyme
MANPILASATPDDVDALCRALQGFNRPHVGEVPVLPVNLTARAADGALLGGILAEVALQWLEIHVLWVEPQARQQGVGRALLDACERQAIAVGAHSARLDTFDWQAEAFYRERGYTCFARLEDYPAGHERIFMRKRLGGGLSSCEEAGSESALLTPSPGF